MSSTPPSRPIFESSQHRARRRAFSGIRSILAAFVMLGAVAVLVLLLIVVIGLLIG